jgi:predicted transcriptional regulator
MTSKHRITVNLDDEEYEALQRIASGTDRSLAWLGRRAICDFIEQNEKDEAPLLATINATARTQGQAAS